MAHLFWTDYEPLCKKFFVSSVSKVKCVLLSYHWEISRFAFDKVPAGVNFEKTVHMCLTNKRIKLVFSYNMNGDIVKQVDEHKYLAITITSRLKWTTHIDNVCSWSRKKLGLLKHKLGRSSNELRIKAYKAVVRPSLEYASIVWDFHTTTVDIAKIERIQRLAARFIHSRYKRRDSPSVMLQEGNLECLKERRKIARIKFLSCLYFSKLGIEYIT